MPKIPESKFELTGGRAGHVEFEEAGRKGRFAWEMLVSDVDLGTWGESFVWLDTGEPMTRDEVQLFAQEFATASKLRVVLTWPDGEGVIEP